MCERPSLRQNCCTCAAMERASLPPAHPSQARVPNHLVPSTKLSSGAECRIPPSTGKEIFKCLIRGSSFVLFIFFWKFTSEGIRCILLLFREAHHCPVAEAGHSLLAETFPPLFGTDAGDHEPGPSASPLNPLLHLNCLNLAVSVCPAVPSSPTGQDVEP